jgi:hypothetical protein
MFGFDMVPEKSCSQGPCKHEHLVTNIKTNVPASSLDGSLRVVYVQWMSML